MATETLQAGIAQRNARVWWFSRKRKLNTIIFFVTSHCNATCETCFWETPARSSEPGQIACDQCWCTHVCFIHDSLRYSYRAMLSEIPKSYLLRKAW